MWGLSGLKLTSLGSSRGTNLLLLHLLSLLPLLPPSLESGFRPDAEEVCLAFHATSPSPSTPSPSNLPSDTHLQSEPLVIPSGPSPGHPAQSCVQAGREIPPLPPKIPSTVTTWVVPHDTPGQRPTATSPAPCSGGAGFLHSAFPGPKWAPTARCTLKVRAGVWTCKPGGLSFAHWGTLGGYLSL